VTTHGSTQYAAFYDARSRAILAKRRLGTTQWQLRTTPYKGKVEDAHNSISIAVDGDGFLHMAWNHHDSPLQYSRSVRPESLELGTIS
jgi:BNR repeat-containing family member